MNSASSSKIQISGMVTPVVCSQFPLRGSVKLEVKIYESALISPNKIVWHGAYSHVTVKAHPRSKRQTFVLKELRGPRNAEGPKANINSAALLLTCHTIYSEAAVLFYRNNDFSSCVALVAQYLPASSPESFPEPRERDISVSFQKFWEREGTVTVPSENWTGATV